MVMTDDDRIAKRSRLNAEERAAGSADPEAQAEAILLESDIRSADRDAAPDSVVEHRRSEDTVDLTDIAEAGDQ